MKAIFKDEFIAKIRKIPTFIWYIFLAITYFAREAFSIIDSAKGAAETYRNALEEMGITQLNVTPIAIVTAVLTPIISTLIFEIIIRIAYTILGRRYVMAVNQNDFTFRARLVMIIANIILAIININCFFCPYDVSQLITAVFDFSVPALLFIWYYEDFRSRFLPKARQASFFMSVARIYIGIYFVIRLVYFILGMMTISVNTPFETAAISVDLGMTIIVGVLAYIDYLRLKKISLEPEENDIFIKKEEKSDNDDIFKDLGF